MNDLTKKILDNKPDYLNNLKFLDDKYNSIFTKKFNKENNDINILSLFCEMEFGYLLNHLFSNVEYEPKIHNKTHWLVNSHGQKIIFEVKKINPLEQIMQSRINLVKENKYLGINEGSFTNSINDFIPQFSKILNKESNYRNLIVQENYILVICIDVINLQKEFITDTDLYDFLDFNSKYSLIRIILSSVKM